ncbi:MAG: CoA transferase [Ardenticatenaceae bacterium]|nr:CoA transferase [Ardenticatenaceae bacterium]
MTTNALTGTTVLDLSLQLPGPYATMLLRQLGARVIKLEPPDGDPACEIDPWMYRVLNVGKERIKLNLRTALGQRAARQIAGACDVLVEGFRPGVTTRLGLGYQDLHKDHMRLIYCSISGYGQSGPHRNRGGHDLNFLGLGGGLSGNYAVDCAQNPIVGSIPMIDLATGGMAAMCILAALRRLEHTGVGEYLDIAMLDQAVFWSWIKSGGSDRATNGQLRQEAAYGVFQSADGKHLSVAAIEDKFWRALCQLLGWEDWLSDGSLQQYSARKARNQEINARLQDAIGKKPRDVWMALMDNAGVPAACVHNLDDVPGDRQVRERQLFATDDEGNFVVLPPLPAGWRQTNLRLPVDERDAEAALLRDLGLDAAVINELLG